TGPEPATISYRPAAQTIRSRRGWHRGHGSSAPRRRWRFSTQCATVRSATTCIAGFLIRTTSPFEGAAHRTSQLSLRSALAQSLYPVRREREDDHDSLPRL